MMAVAAVAAMMLYWMADSHSLNCVLNKYKSTPCEVYSIQAYRDKTASLYTVTKYERKQFKLFPKYGINLQISLENI